jgi:hypothetical protein
LHLAFSNVASFPKYKISAEKRESPGTTSEVNFPASEVPLNNAVESLHFSLNNSIYADLIFTNPE